MSIQGQFSYLPDDLFGEIISTLTRNDVLRCERVCKQWQALISKDARWKVELTKRGVALVTGTSHRTNWPYSLGSYTIATYL